MKTADDEIHHSALEAESNTIAPSDPGFDPDCVSRIRDRSAQRPGAPLERELRDPIEVIRELEASHVAAKASERELDQHVAGQPIDERLNAGAAFGRLLGELRLLDDLGGLEANYRQGNPLAAWEAWRTCRANGFRAPRWVLEYLDDCGDRLVGSLGVHSSFSEAHVAAVSAPVERGTAPMARGLGFEGQGLGTARKQLFGDSDRLLLALDLVELMRDQGLAFDAACRHGESVRGRRFSRSAALKAFKDAGPVLEAALANALSQVTGEPMPPGPWDRRELREQLKKAVRNRSRKAAGCPRTKRG